MKNLLTTGLALLTLAAPVQYCYGVSTFTENLVATLNEHTAGMPYNYHSVTKSDCFQKINDARNFNIVSSSPTDVLTVSTLVAAGGATGRFLGLEKAGTVKALSQLQVETEFRKALEDITLKREVAHVEYEWNLEHEVKSGKISPEALTAQEKFKNEIQGAEKLDIDTRARRFKDLNGLETELSRAAQAKSLLKGAAVGGVLSAGIEVVKTRIDRRIDDAALESTILGTSNVGLLCSYAFDPHHPNHDQILAAINRSVEAVEREKRYQQLVGQAFAQRTAQSVAASKPQSKNPSRAR